MRPTLRLALRACFFIFFIAGCAGPGVVDEARRQFGEGRGEEALTLLQAAARERPTDAGIRGEYYLSLIHI